MAISSTIYKVLLNISNMTTHFYEDFNLTLAKHPSENETRMMNRILAFLVCAHEDLELSRGISSNDEPDLWQRDITGEIIHWIDLGQPDLKRIKQACGKSKKVSIFTYHENKAKEWFEKNEHKLRSLDKLSIHHLEVIENGPIEQLVSKSMKLNCIIEDDLIYLSDEKRTITIKIIKLL